MVARACQTKAPPTSFVYVARPACPPGQLSQSPRLPPGPAMRHWKVAVGMSEWKVNTEGTSVPDGIEVGSAGAVSMKVLGVGTGAGGGSLGGGSVCAGGSVCPVVPVPVPVPG